MAMTVESTKTKSCTNTEKLIGKWRRENAAKNIKETTLQSLARYMLDGIPTGGFLRAVLANDLRESCGRADMENQSSLVDIVLLIYNYFPSSAWGSYDRYNTWIDCGGLRGGINGPARNRG